jgi:hypothetical protein
MSINPFDESGSLFVSANGVEKRGLWPASAEVSGGLTASRIPSSCWTFRKDRGRYAAESSARELEGGRALGR